MLRRKLFCVLFVVLILDVTKIQAKKKHVGTTRRATQAPSTQAPSFQNNPQQNAPPPAYAAHPQSGPPPPYSQSPQQAPGGPVIINHVQPAQSGGGGGLGTAGGLAVGNL